MVPDLAQRAAFAPLLVMSIATLVGSCSPTDVAFTPANAVQATSVQAAVVAAPFVTIMPGPLGPLLALNGAPFRMIGYEAWLGTPYPPYSYCGWTASQLSSGLAEIANRSGGNTVRMWFFQDAGGPGNWQYFDAAIAEAKANNLHIIPTLINQWGQCEPQVNGIENYKTINWYEGGYKNPNDGYPLAYRDYAIAVAEHYSNEPTIAFWQLLNESEARDYTNDTCPNDAGSATAIRAFADDMVSAIHTVDTNHLINLGTQDNGYCGVQGSDYTYIYGGSIDLCEVHTYDPPSPALPALVAPKLAACLALNKPMFVGEVGFCRTLQPDGSCSTSTDPNVLAAGLQLRAHYYKRRFQAGFKRGSERHVDLAVECKPIGPDLRRLVG